MAKAKWFVFLISGLIIIITVMATVTKLQAELEKERPKSGFTILLAGEDISSFVEGEKVIYVGGANGLFSIDKDTLQAKEIGDYHYVRSLALDERGLWLATDTGLLLIKEEISRVYTTDDGLPDNRVLYIYPVDKGHFWLGTWGGALEISFDEENEMLIKNQYNQKNGLLVDNVNVINQDDRGGLWFGSYVAPRGGLSLLANDKWQYFTTEDDLLHGNVTSIITRYDGRVVVGAGLYKYGGATIFKKTKDSWEKTESLTRESGLAGEKVRSLYEDQQQRLWVGSEYDGLVIIDKNDKKILTDASGLSHNEVKCINEDLEGTIWIGTMRGLTRIEKGVV